MALGDPNHVPDPRRNWRSDGKERPIEASWFQRAKDTLAAVFNGGAASQTQANQPDPAQHQPQQVAPVGGQAPGTSLLDWQSTAVSRVTGTSFTVQLRDPWMGPGNPLRPVVQNPEEVRGREWDYPAAANIGVTPRRFEGTSFAQLEALAQNLDILRLAIETRKDQFGNLTWSCLPIKDRNEKVRRDADERSDEIEAIMRRPDRRTPWTLWARSLIDAQLVTDAPAIYVRRTVGGKVHSLELIQGADINVLLDHTGRVPEPPYPAYQHILKGLPAVNYTTDELIYWPRNIRVGHRYGFSPVEQIIMTVNIAIRREVAKLSYFTEGNVPEALVSVPKTWTPEQIEHFQKVWDAMLADQNTRRKMKFIPGEMNYQPTRSEQSLGDGNDEWLARVVCYAFSLPPMPFVKMMNRATADNAYEAALAEGLQPMMMWFKSLMDHIIQNVFGYTDLELVWDDARRADPAEQDQRDLALIQIGRKSIDEVRIARGEAPIGMDHAVWGIGPMGMMFVTDILKAQKMGLMMPRAPMAPDAMGGMPGMMGHNGGPPMDGAGAPNVAPGVHPKAAQLLNDIDPTLLEAVGLGAKGEAARRIDVTDDDTFRSDPLSNVVFHPTVLRTLRDVEGKLKRGRR